MQAIMCEKLVGCLGLGRHVSESAGLERGPVTGLPRPQTRPKLGRELHDGPQVPLGARAGKALLLPSRGSGAPARVSAEAKRDSVPVHLGGGAAAARSRFCTRRT